MLLSLEFPSRLEDVLEVEVREAVSAASVLPAEFSAGPGLEAQSAVNQLLGGQRERPGPSSQGQAGLQGGDRGLGSTAVTGGLLHYWGHHSLIIPIY